MADSLAARLVIESVTVLVLLGLLLSGCSGEDRSAADRMPEITSDDMIAIREDLLRVTREHDRRAFRSAESLVAAVDRFLATPGEDGQQALREAWLAAHQSFSSLVALIHIAGQEAQISEIDAWPMEPGFLDSLAAWPDSGIINDFTLDVTSAVLIAQHGITDPGEVSLGFHPIEYYAFVRPIEDFIVPEEAGAQTDRVLRRRTALKLIVAHLAASILLLEEQLVDGIMQKLTPQADTGNGIVAMRALLQGSHRTALHAFHQAGLFIETDRGHCAYAGASGASLLAELETLRRIYRREGNVMYVLDRIDPATTKSLDLTIDQALGALGGTDVPEEERARLPLMFSAISHRLEELERHFN